MKSEKVVDLIKKSQSVYALSKISENCTVMIELTERQVADIIKSIRGSKEQIACAYSRRSKTTFFGRG